MNLAEQYIVKRSEGLTFDFLRHIAMKVLEIDIDIDVFEYKNGNIRAEKAHVTFKKDSLKYECDFCESHNYEMCFFPVTIHGGAFICFRKALYGFVLISTATLEVEYEYFPECVFDGRESFVIADVKQIENILLFDGCYWAFPYECFAFDYDKKLFLNISELCGMYDLNEMTVEDNKLILYGVDENEIKNRLTVSIENVKKSFLEYGKKDF